MGRTFSAVPYTYLKRGVYYFVMLCSVMATSLSSASNWNNSGDGRSGLSRHSTELNSTSSKQKYAYQLSEEVVRSGKYSQRFELRHGDCGNNSFGDWGDCDNDRQRIERVEGRSSRSKTKFNKERWYGFSIFIPTDFKSISPANLNIAQVKLSKIELREPLWMMQYGRDNIFIKSHTSGQECTLLSNEVARGSWVDFIIRADYTLDKAINPPGFMDIWVNGNRIDCKFDRPLMKSWTLKHLAGANWKYKEYSLSLRYGIYNSYLSRWFYYNKTKDVSTLGFLDNHAQTGHTSISHTNRPFEFDWGVKFPTTVLFFDEVRVGDSYAAVDPANQETAVD